ncbi:MAG: hypothetical protein OJF60_002192 [Burkholderiaceae bacterium]|jgi:hypothetical protein|nr:MAG: hypothetical protein OJF60_002192 [Burkholderiaceae bacterium]
MAQTPAQLLFATYFEGEQLTLAINSQPYTPQIVGKLKLFEESGISTTKAMIELNNNRLDLIPSRPRGSPGAIYNKAQRSLVEVPTAHLITRDTILADTIQDMRAFGTTELQDIETHRNTRLAGMRANLDATLEYINVGAIKGKVLSADGDVILDVNAAFNQSQPTQNLALDTSTTVVANQIIAAVRKSEDGSQAPGVATGYAALAAPDVMDKLRAHPSVAQSFLNWSGAQTMLADIRPGVLTIGGVTFYEYRSPAGGPVYVEDGTAYLLPMGIPGLYVSRFAPADYLEAANTVGLPMYAKAVLDDFGRSINMEAQSNPISLVTRPAAIVKLTA